MDLHIYLEPVQIPESNFSENYMAKRLGEFISVYSSKSSFPDLDKVKIALIGVKEDRAAVNNEGCANAPDVVRKYFYNLYPSFHSIKIADLGNIKAGHSISDTYFALSTVLSELIKLDILPIVIGGSQDLAYANYLAYENLGQIINIVQIDSSFDLGTTEDELNSKTYLTKIITHQPNFLFNYTNIGYQTYFVDQNALSLMNNLFFDVYRLGMVRSNLQEVEPMVRNADMISFDISAIKHADAPGNGNASPNGFYGEEACQIARYAGISDKLSSIGFYELNPLFDNDNITAHLVAQMIWYLIDGVASRKNDYPSKRKEECQKYVVDAGDSNEIIFYKSKKSERWWMEVPCPVQLKAKFERHYLVPCSISDYETACKMEMPNRWWQAYQKMM